ncbi:MAG: GDYXXLXY domain-containing protein, partial [Hoeflea sp.]|nr:GDYXXLXY domain-containing protein [Hoeflea sp.]
MMALAQILRRQLSPVIAAIVSAVVLIGMLGYMIQARAAILREGTEIILKTSPVDPRDLMRGDYVRLAYDISVVDGALFKGDWPEESRLAPVWLTLEPGEDGVAIVTSVSLEKPETGSATAVYLKSQPVWLYESDRGKATSLSLSFGIERYYVPEGEGLEIEDARNEQRT